jgi:uncharacterized protein YoxC
MSDLEWLTLKECAGKFNIDHNRLRDWTNKDLVSYDKRSNQRYIPSSEFLKIEKIIRIFDEAKRSGTRKTFEDVKIELQKENLYTEYKKDKEREQIEKTTEIALNSINAELKDTLMIIARGFENLQQENRLIKSQFNQLLEQHNEALDKISALEQTVKEYHTSNNQVAAAIESKASHDQETSSQLFDLNRKMEEFMKADREKRAKDLLTQWKIENQLEREALHLWNQKSEEERTKRTGFFKRKEDMEKRHQFIKEYINLHLDSRVKQEYEI